MSSKGPLDGFYKDSLRIGNLKVDLVFTDTCVHCCTVHILMACSSPHVAVLQQLQLVSQRQRRAGGDHIPWAAPCHHTATNGTTHAAGVGVSK